MNWLQAHTYLTTWLGLLVGVVVGHYLTRSWQREQWLRDCRKEEFPELLTTLKRSYAILVELGMPLMALGPDEQRKIMEAETAALATIRDRIYIAKDVKKYQIYESWRAATRSFDSDHDVMGFAEAYAIINALIVAGATREETAVSVIRRTVRRLRGKRLLVE